MSDLARAILIGIACFGAVLTGCSRPSTLSTEYGKVNGIHGAISVNGTSVFHDMFVERGFKVRRTGRISPNIDRYETVVWFPDNHFCPGPKAVEAIDQWLKSGWGRTFIYVGRDYISDSDYLADISEDAPPNAQEELLRRIAETDLSRDSPTTDFFSKEELTNCDWFELAENTRTRTEILSGEFAKGLSDNASVEVSSVLVPSDPKATENLLLADGKPIVFKSSPSSLDYVHEGNIVVVSNGSFLVNYALVDQDNRKLAGKLIDQCPPGDVLFLESDQAGIRVSNSDTINQNRWAWIAQAPLCYIVPHFLMWGILFCFVFFPIFGRPRETSKKSTSSFRNHINALGKMISRTDHPNRAVNKIRKYQDMVGETKRKKD